MTFVKPFCGTRYNPKTIPEPSEVIAWPYDCISEADQDAYYKQHEYNVIRLIKAKTSPMDSGTDNQFTRACADLRHWYESGILVTDPAPSFYYYRVGYELPDGTSMLRKGFFGLLRLSDNDRGAVLAHENHDPGPVADRLGLMKATGANLSPVFVTYSDPDRNVLSLMAGSLPVDPIIKTTDFGQIEQTIWRISDPVACEAIGKAMQDRKVMIADGHHRYRAALAFRDLARKQQPDAGPDAPFEYILAYFSPMEDGGGTILPTHRAVSGLPHFSTDRFLLKLSKSFYIKEVPLDQPDPEQALAGALEESAKLDEKDETFIMGLRHADSLFLLNFKKDAAKTSYPRGVPQTVRSLDVAILQKVIFEKLLGIDPGQPPADVTVDYFSDEAQTFSRLKDGAQLVFLMNPTRMDTLWTCALAGLIMPRKSTYFYPKVPAGLVFHMF